MSCLPNWKAKWVNPKDRRESTLTRANEMQFFRLTMKMLSALVINMQTTQNSRSSTISRMIEDEGGSRHGHKEIFVHSLTLISI